MLAYPGAICVICNKQTNTNLS